MLVRGAIPGERVAAWIERAEKRLAYAVTREVLEPSPDRVVGAADPLCGGLLYAHIAYDDSWLKARRRARRVRARRTPSAREPFEVAARRTDGYRMRARLHVRGSRVGFYREGTHQLCDAAETGQLLEPAAAAVLRRLQPSIRNGARRFDVDLDHRERRRAINAPCISSLRPVALSPSRMEMR